MMKLTNNQKHVIHVTLYSLACTLITNAIIQGFMLKNGIPETTVMLYLSVLQITQVVVMLGFSLIVDRIKKIMQLYSLTILLQIILFVALIIFCLTPDFSLRVKTVGLFAAGIITNIDQAVLAVVQYKTPYYYLDINRLGNIMGITSFFCGLTGALSSSVMIFVTARFDYNKSMLFFFLFGITLIIISFIVAMSIRSTEPTLPKRDESKAKKVNILKYKPFYILALPHLMRGFNSGIFVSTMTIGFSLGITKSDSASAVLSLILQSAYMIGNFFFSKVSSPKRNSKLTFFSSLCLIILMPLMMSGNIAVFYTMYFLSALCISVIDSAVPCVIVELVDYDYIGQYSSYRMLLHTLGVALSSLVAIPLLRLLGGVGTMIFSSSLMVAAGSAYFIFMKFSNKNRQSNG
ncbi:MAG: MFS transporter [Ruminococcaceae bacterium]|nr:MFS transporter [Oscillospiraceae bacterium]